MRASPHLAGADVLAISAEAIVAPCGFIDYLEEAFRVAAKLDIGPAVFSDGCHVKAVS